MQTSFALTYTASITLYLIVSSCATTQAELADGLFVAQRASKMPAPMEAPEAAEGLEVSGPMVGDVESPQPIWPALVDSRGLAQTGQSAAPGGDEWEYLLSPYLWAVGIDGDVTIAGSTVPLDLSFSDILDDFSGGGSLFFEGRKGRWGFAIDATYITMETKDSAGSTTIKTDTSVSLLGLDGTYRLGPNSPWDLILGARLFDIDTEVSITGFPTVGGSISSTQAVVGARGRWSVAESWHFSVRGDVGFGSDSSWQLLALAGYQVGTNWGLHFGYRLMDLDVEDGSAGLDATLEGVMLGAVFQW